MNIEQIVTEQDALEQLRADSQKSLLSTVKLLEWLVIKEEQWVDEFQKLSKEAQATDMNHYKINYLIGLTILIPVLPQFRAELQAQQTVLVDYDRIKFDDNGWGSNDDEIDDWLKQ